VINRADVGDGQTRQYCRQQRIDVLAEIPDDREVAEAYSRGEMACVAIPRYRDIYLGLFSRLETRASVHAR